ncbi:XdhC family protein [Chroococcidiopsis thermalis]|uniref:XshC-Cox1-family protein n=1 Tax=Chroococcidiopsis thermalis (strain PCC 7203) TaxID=251229 RepID=K9TZ48_CHRTP|nr:XdhC/CoxI family protein [Chroococcidiopsis thermalis]AFY87663.1 protein of unknown function DUF182 [Chroococcidiopsis thermalis PCC 7203]
MRNVVADIKRWWNQGDSVALATVVCTQGSSPREPGAVMAVSSSGEVAGSISGGCVEGAVVEEALAAIALNQPRLLTYGVADELGFVVGLTCGGTIQVFVEPLMQKCFGSELPMNFVFDAICKASEQPIALCTLVEGTNVGAKMLVTDRGAIAGSLGNAELDQVVSRNTQRMLTQGWKNLSYYGANGECGQADVAIFIESFVPQPHFIAIGAVDFARSLCKLGKILGYRITVCDARSRFATPARFPEADEIVVNSPGQYLQSIQIDARTIITVLTHDPKFDVPALIAAVRTPAAYIGAMGSRKATADRIRRLKEAGLTETELARICAPIGLDIGANSLEETAVSIMAEVIALKSGRSGCRLSQTQQKSIHVK